MPVKRSQSAARVLKVVETIAREQPIGVSELAKQIGADKSATQRDIMTLADAGWIQPAGGTPTRWELTTHIHSLAQHAHGGSDLRQRARPILEALQQACGETVLLITPEAQQFVVTDLVESTHFLRTTAYVGLVVPLAGSATGRALLPYMSEEDQWRMTGVKPDKHMREHFRHTLERGYAVSEGEVYSGATTIVAPVFEADGRPVAAIGVSAPTDRLPQQYHDKMGKRVVQAARQLSRGQPLIHSVRDD